MKTRNLCLTMMVGALLAGAALAQDAKPNQPVVPPHKKETVWSLMVKGGIVMIPMGICSVLGLAIATERFISLRRVKIIPPDFVGGLMQTLRASPSNSKAAVEFCERSQSCVGHIFRAGIQNLAKGEAAVERAIEDAGARQVEKLKRSLQGLSVIAAVTPLLGLLGTVYGMIKAFEVASYAGTGKSELLAKGIYEALVATASGLTIAIIALVLYHHFSSRVDALMDEVDEMCIDFMNQLSFEQPSARQESSRSATQR